MTNLTKDSLLKIYNEKQSIKFTALAIGQKFSTTYKLLKKFGISTKRKRNTCNEDFFAEDNELSMYWAGFLAADGCVKGKKEDIIQLSLAKKDACHVERFKHDLNATNKISIQKRDEQNRICIYSVKIAKDLLERFGIVPCKTLIYKFPERLINHPLINHFMRGYVDGDGCFYYDKKKDETSQLVFSIVGTKHFVDIFNLILRRDSEIINETGNCYFYNGAWALAYGGNGILTKIYNFLYKNATIYLERKFNIAKYKVENYLERSEIIEKRIQENKNIKFRKNSWAWFHFHKPELDKNKVQELYDKLGSISKVARSLKRDDKAIVKFMEENEIEIWHGYNFTKEQILNAFNICSGDKTATAYYLKVSISYIQKALNEFKITKNNNMFFDKEYESELQFYCAGLLLANSIIDDEKYSIVIKCNKEGGIELFKSFNITLGGIVNNQIHFNSEKICKDLKRFNIDSKKFESYELPQWLMKHSMLNHFLRGFFDFRGSRGNVFEINGPIKFLEQLKVILTENVVINFKPKIYLTHKRRPMIRYSSKFMNKIYDYLYSNATIYLRKPDLATQFLNNSI